MRSNNLRDIDLLIWFGRQRLLELAILVIIIGIFNFHVEFMAPLVPPDALPLLPVDSLLRYVVSGAEAVFAFVIAVQIGVIIWITRLPPRPARAAAWWV